MVFLVNNNIIYFSSNTTQLKKTLESIGQSDLISLHYIIIAKYTQIELIYNYCLKYPGCITIVKYDQGSPLSNQINYIKSRFSILNCLIVIDDYLSVKQIKNFELKCQDLLLPKRAKNKKNPLVSIAIYNYNYGPYIEECLDSIFKQSYQNFEVCISDNASSDESWDVITKFIKLYPKKIKAIRNFSNVGPGFNRENAEHLAKGEYLLVLTSDDYMDSNFLQKTVSSLEDNKDCVFAMVHRDVVDPQGNIKSEQPFYNQSCKINGHSQAAVFMMAGVNPSISQIVYRRSMIGYGSLVGGHVLNVRWFGERIKDFEMCCQHPIIYIKEPLLKNRVHPNSDGSSIDRNLIQAIGQFVLVHQFRDIASSYSNQAAIDRLPSAIEKISNLCLRYSVDFILKNEILISKRYLALAISLTTKDLHGLMYDLLYDYHFNGNAEAVLKIKKKFKDTSRKISYSPPEDSVEINV